MKKILIFIFTANIIMGIAEAQPYHYPFGYNFNFLATIDDAFFEELSKDLGRNISFNNTTKEYTYIQHLINQHVFFSRGSQRIVLKNGGHNDVLHAHLQQGIAQFPTQSTSYYWLARFYLDNGNSEKALKVLHKAAREYNISPDAFSYIAELHAENEEFIQGYNDLIKQQFAPVTTLIPDSSWIALIDSIMQQDQMYRGKKPFNWEKQKKIDDQNALLLKKLVREHGWISKYLGKDYAFPQTPVMHFSVDNQLFFLDYIIADCMSYLARWNEAESVIWKMVIHTTPIAVDNETYHSLPLICIDPSTSLLDLEQSMLGISSAVRAAHDMLRRPHVPDIVLIATSELSGSNHLENLNLLKKYFILLGIEENKIHIQPELLDKETEDQLKLKTPIVIKRKGSFSCETI